MIFVLFLNNLFLLLKIHITLNFNIIGLEIEYKIFQKFSFVGEKKKV